MAKHIASFISKTLVTVQKVGGGFFCYLATLFATAAVAAAGPTTDVSAHYKLSFGGLDVGTYDFQSQFDGKAYTATSKAKVSALFGAFKWRGDIQSSGALVANRPRPAAYQMTFKTKSKEGSVKLDFDNAGVTSVALVPNKPPHHDAVPLKPENYKNVFDPLSAILAMTYASGQNPCDKKIPIFDGKARFDLALSYKGSQKISDKNPSGQPRELVVCRVKYQPVAGHKPKEFVDPWVEYNNIEIAFRSIPSANIYVPYTITIPTTVGSAMMSAETVTITSPNGPQIALRQ